MRIVFRAVVLAFACQVLISAILLPSRSAQETPKPAVSPEPAAPNESLRALRLNTLGVAYLNQQRPSEAQKLFEQALGADPKFAVARLNLGVSLLNQQKAEAARDALLAAALQLPRDPYAWYNLGLAYKDLGDLSKGVAAFEHVTEIVPDEADAYYFVGYLNSQLQKYDQAIAAYQKGLALFPYHASSEFGIARAYQRKGDMAAAREHLAKFQKITTEHLGTPFGAGYGDQGRLSLAELVTNPSLAVPPAIPVYFTAQNMDALLQNASKPSSAPGSLIGPSTGACFFDFDGDGKPDLFLVSATLDGVGHLLHNVGSGRFEDVTQQSGFKLSGSGLGCAAGDFDNDGHTDLAVCLSGGVRLLHNLGDGKFEDVTDKVGIRSEKGCVGVTFVDYDHDSDLDLYVTSSPDAAASPGSVHNTLWRNNGNSTFTDVSAETAMGVPASGAGLVTTDFNNDRAIDFVLAGGPGGAAIYLNPREGKFVSLPAIDFKKENLPPGRWRDRLRLR